MTPGQAIAEFETTTLRHHRIASRQHKIFARDEPRANYYRGMYEAYSRTLGDIEKLNDANQQKGQK